MKNQIASKIAGLALNLILLIGWLWLYWPVLQTLPALLTGEDFRTNQMMLTAIAGLLIYRVHKARAPLPVDATPHFFLPGFTLLLLGSVGYLLSERLLTISSISTSLFVLASYGLLGLWLPPQRWRAGLPMMLLVVSVLPFGPQMESFLGYPLRIFTANLVRDLLAGFGFHTVGVDTILVFENGVSQVDIPCSGVKSLWTGALFLLGATWVENRPLTGRWWLIAVGMTLLLVLTNFLRVAILSLAGPALGLTELARLIHVPLGVLGFAGACAAALFLLGQLKENTIQNTEPPVKTRWLRPLLLACIFGMAAIYSPHPVVSIPTQTTDSAWHFAEGLRVQTSPLSLRELGWLRLAGAETIDRYRFEWQGNRPISGTFILLTSHTWPAQHQPERCFEVFGLTQRQSSTYLVTENFPLRLLSFSVPEKTERLSAAYWLQSISKTTEDYSQPIWDTLTSQRENWVLVTVLLDQDYASQPAELNPFFEALHNSVNISLQKGVIQ